MPGRRFNGEEKFKLSYSECEVCGYLATGWYRKCPEHGIMKNTVITLKLKDVVSMFKIGG